MKGKKPGKKKGGNDNGKLVYIFIIIIISLAGLLYFIGVDNKEAPKPITKRQEPQQREKPIIAIKPATLPQQKQGITYSSRLAVIIDDIGHNRRFIDLIELEVPITLAIIPFTPHSHEAAMKGRSAGVEVILHLPMEPKGYPALNPGKGALLTSMSPTDIRNNSIKGMEAIPNISGVNNHMGSLFTEYAEGMKIVLEEVQKRNLFFVDSKTSNNSKGYLLARSMKIKTAERNVFLDNVKTEEAITIQLMKAIAVARKEGEAIAIGHPYLETISVLKKIAPTLLDDGIELVVASQITK